MTIVALLGPDGSGKSTLIEALKSLWNDDPIIVYHFRTGIRAGTRRPVVRPYDRRPHSTPISLAKIGWWLVHHAAWGMKSALRPAKHRRALVVFDRFLFDVMADPRRYRVPTWISRVPLHRLVWPKPDLVVILQPPAHVVQARKAEVEYQETELQLRGYETLLTHTRHVLRLGHPVSPREAAAMILDRLAQRR